MAEFGKRAGPGQQHCQPQSLHSRANKSCLLCPFRSLGVISIVMVNIFGHLRYNSCCNEWSIDSGVQQSSLFIGLFNSSLRF